MWDVREHVMGSDQSDPEYRNSTCYLFKNDPKLARTFWVLKKEDICLSFLSPCFNVCMWEKAPGNPDQCWPFKKYITYLTSSFHQTWRSIQITCECDMIKTYSLYLSYREVYIIQHFFHTFFFPISSPEPVRRERRPCSAEDVDNLDRKASSRDVCDRSNPWSPHTLPRKHTLTMQTQNAERRREAFIELLKQKYPHHASAIAGHQDRLRDHVSESSDRLKRHFWQL